MTLKSFFQGYWPQLTFILLAVAWFFRAYYYTYYGIGIYSFIDIFLVILIVLLVLRFLVKQDWQKAWRGAWIAGSLLTFFHLSYNVITKYRPTHEVIIHPDVEGCIYLFSSTLTEDGAPFQIDANGIGYIPRGGRFDVRFMYRGEDITPAWEHSQLQNLTVYDPDSIMKTSYFVQCFDLDPKGNYAGRNSYPFIGCINEELFQNYIDLGWVEQKLLYRQTWIKRGPQYNWEFSPERSTMPED